MAIQNQTLHTNLLVVRIFQFSEHELSEFYISKEGYLHKNAQELAFEDKNVAMECMHAMENLKKIPGLEIEEIYNNLYNSNLYYIRQNS
jgi:hypothetical protein